MVLLSAKRTWQSCPPRGRGEMVDARDLKSLGSNFPCRFKSGRPHHPSLAPRATAWQSEIKPTLNDLDGFRQRGAWRCRARFKTLDEHKPDAARQRGGADRGNAEANKQAAWNNEHQRCRGGGPKSRRHRAAYQSDQQCAGAIALKRHLIKRAQ